jgi:opacity protein-like surface antigen
MIKKNSAAILGAICCLGTFGSAQAADLYGNRGGSIKDDAMPALMNQSAARFYVRADASFAKYDHPNITENHQYDLTDNRIEGNWAAGGGIGYYFNKNIRADITLEHRFETDVSGVIADPAAPLGGARHFGMKSTLALANLYYDFDTRGRFTPYVGAGLGFVRNETTAGIATDGCGCTGTIDPGKTNSVAAALMAGMSINLTGRGPAAGSGDHGGGDAARNIYLDVGYRFLYLGEVSTGAVRATPVAAPTTTIISDDPTVADIHAHEFRVGLRYDFR